MFDGLVPDLAPRLMIAIGGVAIAFLVFIAVLIFLRRRNSPLFIKGGRVREHRLLVMDAAAVDAKRRLVLVRRDDVEHLIMIGGPSDIVIETGIAGGGRQKTAGSPAERPGANQSPVVAQKPAAAPVAAPAARPIAASPVAAGPAVVTAIRSAPDQAEAMRRRQGQNGDAAQNARRQERQAARAAEAAKASAPKAAAVSAMGPLLYSEGRTQPDDTKTVAQAVETAQPVRRDAEPQPRPSTAQAENILDVARGRVLPQNPEPQQQVQVKAVSEDTDPIRELERQLDASKAAAAETARAEEARAQAARLEAERVAAVRADAERAEAVRAEAARLEAIRIEAQKAETARLEAERAEKARLEAERAAAESAEAEKIEAEKAEAARAEAARVENERVAAARAEAMARFEAARRAQAEQRQQAQQAQQAQQPVAEQTALEQPVVRPATVQASVIEQSPIRQPATQQAQWPVAEPVLDEPAISGRAVETASLDDENAGSQERLASDFEKLLEAELEADGVLDHYPAPVVTGERREPGAGTPAVNPVKRDAQPITGAIPGVSIEHDMARRLGEISLNKKNDAL